MRGLIRSASLTNFAEVARASGLDSTRLARELGLPQRCLRDPDLTIPLDAARQLLEVAAERSGNEAFGLLMAETRQLSNLGPVGLLVREQPTVRLAIDALARYSKRLNEALFLKLEETGNVVVLREELIVGHAGAVRQSTELAIGVVFRVLRTLLGPHWRPLRVCFAHDAPADRSVHERVFGRNVEFGHAFNGIVFSRSDLESPNPTADPAMARYARQLIESSSGDETADLSAQVRDLVVTLLGSGRCTIEQVAQHMGVDRRTIHRQLAREGESFSTIVDSVRRELADRYLRDRKRSLTEISSMLGFSAPSGFSRWYQKQFHASPSEHRSRPPARVR
jgi:AraC-like DNA-binding protein